jgi:SAM-dependent methyltransferase
VSDNSDIFGTVEFEYWAGYAGLIPAERYVIETYLDPQTSTLEAGTGGGRILLALQEMGFEHLSGFDYVPSLIEAAKQRDTAGTIDFRVQDAASLEYGDGAFGQIVYLQQILSLAGDEEHRRRALAECVRVLAPGGTAVFSLLSYESRLRSPPAAALLVYLRVLRLVTGRRRSPQDLPWFRLGGRFNRACLLDRGPYNHWYRLDEACRMFEAAGLAIRATGWGSDVADGNMQGSCAETSERKPAGMIMVVCSKECP